MTPDYAGWVNVGTPDQPDFCSIGAALALGRVHRHYQHGFIVLVNGHGHEHRMSAAAAIAEGHIDSAAATIIAQREGCLGTPRLAPSVYVAPPPPPPSYQGTPAGAVIEALAALLKEPNSVAVREGLAGALEGFQKAATA